MADSVPLVKANPLLPAEDYTALRSKGFGLIEKMGSDIWTNYNNSDPGITILEAVCYAITDLAYRTGFDIKDILAPEQFTDNTWKQVFYTARQILHNSALTKDDYRKLIIDIDGVRNAWLTPSKDYEVPIWIDYNHIEKRMDYDCTCADKEEKICFGKLGIKQVTTSQAQNNWKAQTTKLGNKIDEIKKQLGSLPKPDDLPYDTDITVIERLVAERQELAQLEAVLQDELDIINNAVPIAPEIVEIEGLYNLMVEYEEDIIDGNKREEVRQLVIERLAANRNLCEDFLSIDAVEYYDFGIGASIVLEDNADPDVVLAQIFFTIYKYFTPSVPFYTIQQMLDKGYQVDEIFDGPALSHGFIDTTDLDRTDLYRNSILSEIIAQVSGISGIKGITFLNLPFTSAVDSAKTGNYFQLWVKDLQDQRKVARVLPIMSQIMFCKQREFISYNTGAKTDRSPNRMLKLFKDLKTLERKYKLIGTDLDFAVPAGEYMNLQDYYPITYTLPMAYGVSERAGLPADADAARQTQALQLGGYLLFFEQILADYLVQLDHLRTLFTFDDSVRHTYYTRALTEIENLNALLIDKNDRGAKNFNLILEDFLKVIQGLVETPKLFYERRNGFLDHMLARFSENLDDYESLMSWLEPAGLERRLIQDKTRILKNEEYKFISSYRGNGYNYTLARTWDTENVSGTERRICRLLGFESAQRRSLVPEYLLSEPLMVQDDPTKPPEQKVTKQGVPLNVIKILDPENNEQVVFTSVEVMQGCCTELLMESILEHADNRIYFKFNDEVKTRSRKSAGLVGKFWFELFDGTDPATAVLLGTSDHFQKKSDRDSAFEKLEKVMRHINSNEGMHLIEHILLRPKLDEVLDEDNQDERVSCLNICLDGCDLDEAQNEYFQEPPYRKKISRIPAEKCYDEMPWILEYLKPEADPKDFPSRLFQKVTYGDPNPVMLKFRRYEDMIQRINDLNEFGTERINYEIVADQENPSKYGFIIHGANGVVLAQSLFIFSQIIDGTVTPAGLPDIETEITTLMAYFGYLLDLYCSSYPCDSRTDPYSFRTTVVLPCWPKRLRNLAFRRLVEQTILSESPAHVQTRVVWIGIEEMIRFEKAYNDWLTEMSQTEVPDYEIVNPLVHIINSLRPCGVCDDECDHHKTS